MSNQDIVAQLKAGLEPFLSKNEALNLAAEGDTVEDMDRSQISDMIAASEAKTDVKFEKVLSEMRVLNAQTNGKLDTLGAKVDARPSGFQLFSWIVGVGIAVIAAIIGASNLIVRALS